MLRPGRYGCGARVAGGGGSISRAQHERRRRPGGKLTAVFICPLWLWLGLWAWAWAWAWEASVGGPEQNPDVGAASNPREHELRRLRGPSAHLGISQPWDSHLPQVLRSASIIRGLSMLFVLGSRFLSSFTSLHLLVGSLAVLYGVSK